MLLPSRGATLPNNRIASCSSFILRIFLGAILLPDIKTKKALLPFTWQSGLIFSPQS
jgi:hypothetical protein